MADASKADGGLHIDPMHQFAIEPLFGHHVGTLTFTNASLWMMIVVGVASLLFVLGANARALVPGRLQSFVEIIYEFVRGMVRDVAGNEGLKYFPFVFTVFVFILFANMLGMLPKSFTVTSHLAVTGAIALSIFVFVTILGFVKHGLHFLEFFVPKDAPLVLKPLLAIIEVISYFVRPFSHSVRLGANMVAGHAMLKVFAGFATALGIYGATVTTVPVAALSLIMMVALTALEFLVAFLQAYVFAILTCIYLNDALHMH